MAFAPFREYGNGEHGYVTLQAYERAGGVRRFLAYVQSS